MNTPSPSILGAALAAAGHVVRSCAACGRHFAADTDHAGEAHKWRRYCSRECRAYAAGRRIALPRQRARVHRRQHHDLIARHALEDAGQLDLTGQPLPPVPTPTGGTP